MVSPDPSRPAIHIYSDGTAHSTRVVGPDGILLPAKEVSLRANASGDFEVTITLSSVKLDMDGPASLVIFECPLCKTEVAQHGCMGS